MTKHPEITNLIKLVKSQITPNDVDWGDKTPYHSAHTALFILKQLEHAERYAYLSTDMKDMHPTTLHALQILAKKGVDVRITVEVNPDNKKDIQKYRVELEQFQQMTNNLRYIIHSKEDLDELEKYFGLGVQQCEETLKVDDVFTHFSKTGNVDRWVNKRPLVEMALNNFHDIRKYGHNTYQAAIKKMRRAKQK